MKGIYHIWKRAIPLEVCERLMEEASHLPEMAGTTGSKGPGHDASGVTNTDTRNSIVRWVPINIPRYKWIYEYIDGFVQIANKQMFGVDLWGPQQFQYTEYNGSGTHYTWHMDTDMMDPFTMEHRKLSAVIILNNKKEFNGGAFEIQGHEHVKNEFGEQGDMLIFPSFLRHRVKKLTKGVRHSLVIWYGGPKWR
mgnify:CR=1 FL=1